MKISGPRQIDSAALQRTTRRGGGGKGGFSVDAPAAERAAAPVTKAGPISAVDALLTLQGVPEAAQGQRRAIRRATDLLDLLEDIRLGLLEGAVPEGKLKGLLRIVETRRDAVADPGLTELLDEIELRAQVELAKFGTAATAPA